MQSLYKSHHLLLLLLKLLSLPYFRRHRQRRLCTRGTVLTVYTRATAEPGG